VIAAARAHLAMLPRWKEIEVVRWTIVNGAGRGTAIYDDEGTARCACPAEWQVVKLTGTAKVREAAQIAERGCLVPPDGGSPTDAERKMCEAIAAAIRASKETER
jgi:hypothetical protein